MVKCNECKFCIRTIDGDEESFWGQSYAANVSYDFECNKGYHKKFNLDNEINMHFRNKENL